MQENGTPLPSYTEEMRERAQAWIAERYAGESEEIVFAQYVDVCFRTFIKRVNM